ncbi:hypothetical protein MUG91_G278n6 [Manis pentadactyla]|nr:hypothetical protein MUG91_G278n6 [Manis pentadactyla]
MVMGESTGSKCTSLAYGLFIEREQMASLVTSASSRQGFRLEWGSSGFHRQKTFLEKTISGHEHLYVDMLKAMWCVHEAHRHIGSLRFQYPICADDFALCPKYRHHDSSSHTRDTTPASYPTFTLLLTCLQWNPNSQWPCTCAYTTAAHKGGEKYKFWKQTKKDLSFVRFLEGLWKFHLTWLSAHSSLSSNGDSPAQIQWILGKEPQWLT